MEQSAGNEKSCVGCTHYLEENVNLEVELEILDNRIAIAHKEYNNRLKRRDDEIARLQNVIRKLKIGLNDENCAKKLRITRKIRVFDHGSKIYLFTLQRCNKTISCEKSKKK